MYRVAETEPAAGRQRRRPEKSDRKNVRLELAEEMVSGWPAEAGDHERTAEDAAAPPPAEAEPAKLEERWAKKGAGVSSGMVRSPAMHEGFRPEEWSVVRTPQTPEKIVEVDERPAEKHGGDARKPHKEKKHKKRSKDRDKDASRGESSSRSRERTKNRDKTKQRSSKSPKRRSTVSDLVATEEVDPLSARGPEQKPALSSWDLRLSALGDDMVDRTLLSAKPSAESLRSVSPGSDNVFASSWQEGGAAPGAAGLRLARLDALSSDPPDTVQCSSCGERMRTPDAARTRSTSRERTPPREGGGEGEAEVGRGEGSPAEGRQKGPRPGEVDAPTLSEPAKSERHKKNLPEQPRDSTVGRPQPDLVPKEQPLEAGKRTKQPHTTEHRRPEAAAGGGPSKGARELQPGTAARERQTSRGSSRRRGADRADRVMSEERVLDPRPATQARAKSEERYTRDPLQTVSPRTSQDSLSRPTDASTQSTISMRELHEDEGGVYAGHFPAARWLYIGADEEMKVWRKKPRCESQPEACPESTLSRSPSVESTESEREFRRSYQAISHRMVHRKASGHMFKQMEDKSFAGDKSVVMQKCSGEFGFRIHGSRPVVVSAIEPGTPARLSGLEVGDIIISINGNRVLESSHGDVVKIAHAGSDQLKLEVASTSSVLATPESWSCVRQGPLWRRSGSAGAWCRRWGVLKADASLYLFKRAEDVHPLAGLSLTDCTLNTSIDCDREMAFMVECEGAEPVALAAESAEEYENWLESLRTVIQESSSESAWQAAVRLNAAGPPGLIHNPDCGGFLSKLGHRWRCWKRLYCVLKDGVMYFYRGDSEPAAFGAAYLHGYRVQSSGVGGRRPSFEVSPPQPRLRHFYFIADSETERKRWLAALEYSIDRWIKVAH
ncbi:uncharacterized protein LOC119103455 [Pollicipes pollicipes]|uniref:uncharacterized protein LOC119103455 n=1 Tax=Pollicipes pollicipes TaxID=41117 RepID=UPI001884C94B|nr:uncharacterized protein LOC119103455 [Pollicipes pollicipes]